MMAFDLYRARLAKAQWDWLEAKVCRRWFGKTREKDRRNGRAEKRSARQQDRREILAEATEAS